MADPYIDYREVSEYGRQFVSAVTPLAGQSELVDVVKLAALVSSAVDAVEAELQKATSDRSDLRGERTDTSEAAETVRDTVSRFYYHLRSLPKATVFDFEAFYPGQTMGDLSSMKPADLNAKAGEVLRGFDTDKNKNVAAFSTWKTELATAHQTLTNALAGKGNATGKSFVATAALVEARKTFLHRYNKVAKPIMRGLLAQLGREHELPLYFKDLAVNEGGKAKAPNEPVESNTALPPATP
ncbi:MAG: hypothetical protein IPM54_29955 [Polyangiaceae bacterium]|nr:hypothetical protein [Polyangiaceae bacterium]